MRQDGQVPYQKSLKVKVAAVEALFNYRNEKGEEKSLVNAAICEESMVVKCTIYDQAKFGRFRKVASIIVRNVITKADFIVITSATKVLFPISELAVPEERMQEGHTIIDPPLAPLKFVGEALTSPPRVRVSVRGRVVQVSLNQ